MFLCHGGSYINVAIKFDSKNSSMFMLEKCMHVHVHDTCMHVAWYMHACLYTDIGTELRDMQYEWTSLSLSHSLTHPDFCSTSSLYVLTRLKWSPNLVSRALHLPARRASHPPSEREEKKQPTHQEQKRLITNQYINGHLMEVIVDPMQTEERFLQYNYDLADDCVTVRSVDSHFLKLK